MSEDADVFNRAPALHGLLGAVESADECVIVTDARLDEPGPRIRYVNPAFETLTGYTVSEVLGRTPRLLQGPETERAVLDRLRRHLEAGLDFEGNVVNYRRDGTAFVMQWRVQPFHDARGAIAGFVSVNRAVEAPSWPAEAAPESLHRQIFEQHSIPMFLVDPTGGRIADANQAAARFCGHPTSMLRRLRIHDLESRGDREVSAELARAERDGSAAFVFRPQLADGDVRGTEVHCSPITIGGQEYLHLIVHDISERDELADEVRRHLYHDALTGLANRTLFRERLEGALASTLDDGWSTAVLRVDIDRFRRLNHVWGQEQADRLLCRIAARLDRQLGARTTLARTGADEFSVLLPRVCGARTAHWLAQRLSGELREPLMVDGRSIHLTASVAVAVSPRDGSDAAGLIDGVDATILDLKRQGGDRWAAFDAARTGYASERMLLVHEIDQALSEGQLSLAWQPTFHFATGTIGGGEALLRWRHPRRGWVPPERFVAAAEEDGQIVRLGTWVLQQATAMAAGAGDEMPGRMAVNISVQQLRAPDFVETVRRTLASTGLPARRLELEITERAFVDESPALIETLRCLRADGVTIAIDDFGTGFSTLQYLKRLPVDRIKIDRVFVTGIAEDEDNQALVATIVGLAERFGLGLTAEGIETRAEAEMLARLGCEWGQGFYFARPRMADPGATPALIGLAW